MKYNKVLLLLELAFVFSLVLVPNAYSQGSYDRCQSNHIDADLNGDGMVNSGDIDIVRANWGSDGSSAALDIVRSNWGCFNIFFFTKRMCGDDIGCIDHVVTTLLELDPNDPAAVSAFMDEGNLLASQNQESSNSSNPLLTFSSVQALSEGYSGLTASVVATCVDNETHVCDQAVWLRHALGGSYSYFQGAVLSLACSHLAYWKSDSEGAKSDRYIIGLLHLQQTGEMTYITNAVDADGNGISHPSYESQDRAQQIAVLIKSTASKMYSDYCTDITDQ